MNTLPDLCLIEEKRKFYVKRPLRPMAVLVYVKRYILSDLGLDIYLFDFVSNTYVYPHHHAVIHVHMRTHM